jgi:hypothetical protein
VSYMQFEQHTCELHVCMRHMVTRINLEHTEQMIRYDPEEENSHKDILISPIVCITAKCR